MAVTKRIDPFLKTNNDTGFGTNASNYGGRFINRDGSFNLRKEGISFFNRYSIYHHMLTLPRWKFAAVIVLFYLLINLLYSIIYLVVGIDQLQGVLATTPWGKFKEAYFFSTETFTTVGYGRVNPVGDGANFVASIEAMTGFLSFALATGLMYGRFARPRSFLVFSQHALVSPYKEGTALMFRFASYKDNHTLTDVQIRVNIALKVFIEGRPKEEATYQFYDLQLERTKVESLPMNWTVVHPIDEESPLRELSQEDLAGTDMEIYVLVKGFNDVYGNTVLQRTSYTYQEIHFNRKFIQMYHETAEGTVMELHKLSTHEAVIRS